MLEAEGHLGLQRGRVADGQFLHVLRVLALLVAVPGLTRQERSHLKDLRTQNVLLVDYLICLLGLLAVRKHNPDGGNMDRLKPRTQKK